MSLVSLPGETLRWHPRIFRTCRSLKDVKQIEADCLLRLDRAALYAILPRIPDPDIAPAPEIVHVLLLASKELVETLVHHSICVHSARLHSSSAEAVADV